MKVLLERLLRRDGLRRGSGGRRSRPVPTLTLLDGVRAVRLKRSDPDQRRFVTFREAGGRSSHANA
jgi:hypothetical protein